MKTSVEHRLELTCIRCGGTRAIDAPEIEEELPEATTERAFEVIFRYHEVFGLCSECRGSEVEP